MVHGSRIGDCAWRSKAIGTGGSLAWCECRQRFARRRLFEKSRVAYFVDNHESCKYSQFSTRDRMYIT